MAMKEIYIGTQGPFLLDDTDPEFSYAGQVATVGDIPGAVAPSSSIPVQSGGAGSAGSDSSYSRGNHQHPAGMQFPAIQVPSADPNNLDDYEEGTWTPTDGSGAGLVLSVTASYTKIGRLVFVTGSVIFPTTTNTATATIGGLPFIPAQTSVGMFYSSGFASGVALQFSGSITFRNASATAYQNSALSGKTVSFSLSYQV